MIFQLGLRPLAHIGSPAFLELTTGSQVRLFYPQLIKSLLILRRWYVGPVVGISLILGMHLRQFPFVVSVSVHEPTLGCLWRMFAPSAAPAIQCCIGPDERQLLRSLI